MVTKYRLLVYVFVNFFSDQVEIHSYTAFKGKKHAKNSVFDLIVWINKCIWGYICRLLYIYPVFCEYAR